MRSIYTLSTWVILVAMIFILTDCIRPGRPKGDVEITDGEGPDSAMLWTHYDRVTTIAYGSSIRGALRIGSEVEWVRVIRNREDTLMIQVSANPIGCCNDYEPGFLYCKNVKILTPSWDELNEMERECYAMGAATD